MSEASKHKHLELIQGVINRMSVNSFQMKGWSVVLVSAILTLSATMDGTVRSSVVCVAYLPILIFWGLDGFFLAQERRYRILYDQVRKMNDKDIDFSMDASQFESVGRLRWINVVLSPTLLAFYIALIFSTTAVLTWGRLDVIFST